MMLYITLNIKNTRKKVPAKYCFRKTDHNKLKEALCGINWDLELKNLTSNQAWEKIKNKINRAIEISTPMTRPLNRKQNIWMNKGTLASVRKKYSLFRRWQVTRSGQDYLQYVKARNLARKECRKAQRQTEQRLASEAKSNPNNIWKYTKSKTASRSGIPNLQKTDGSKAKSDKKKAEALNHHPISIRLTRS